MGACEQTVRHWCNVCLCVCVYDDAEECRRSFTLKRSTHAINLVLLVRRKPLFKSKLLIFHNEVFELPTWRHFTLPCSGTLASLVLNKNHRVYLSATSFLADLGHQNLVFPRQLQSVFGIHTIHTMILHHAVTFYGILNLVTFITLFGHLDAIKSANWQASRIILADQASEPIQASLDDPEAFGEEPVEGPFFNDVSPSESTNYEEHFLGKRSANLKFPGKSYAEKVRSKSARWVNEVLAARGIIPARYQVGQKKEFELAPKGAESFQCGIQKVLPNDWWKPKLDLTGVKKRRIEARRHSWPWQVDIFFYRVENGSAIRVHLCGGTLIDRWHVITAAHCNIIKSQNFALGRPKSYYIRIGQHFRSTDQDSVLQTIRVDKWIDHDHYNDSTSEGEIPKFYLFNDIAFLRLERPVDLSDQVHPICMDFSDTLAFAPGTTCYATGWSLDEFDYQKWVRGEYSEVLNESKSKIAKDSFCLKHHSGYNADVTLCTKYYPGHYSCHGDSGGPLQCERDGRFFLVGIVSYDVATSCRSTGMTYFTKIRGVQSWIEGQLDKSLLEIAASSQS